LAKAFAKRKAGNGRLSLFIRLGMMPIINKGAEGCIAHNVQRSLIKDHPYAFAAAD
jgi:hypothetical protein